MAASSAHAAIGSPYRVSHVKLDETQTPGDSMLHITSITSEPKSEVNLMHMLGEAIRCNCRHSKCIKMYCECFANNRYCTIECTCDSCENNASKESTLARARAGISKRNPHAFTSKVQTTRGTRRHAQGCRCTKSKCLKKYCECFREGMQCTSDCRCIGCANGRESFIELPQVVDDPDTAIVFDNRTLQALQSPMLPLGLG